MTFTLPNSGAAKGEFGYDLPQDMNGMHHAIKEALDLIVELKAERDEYRDALNEIGKNLSPQIQISTGGSSNG